VLCAVGTLLRLTDFTPSSLEEIFAGIGIIDPSDIPPIATFLRRCLTIDPTLRPSALELLKDSWLEGV
jgi:serine/threonine-protein kinase SRPK3